jgi:hypothetical protein
MSRGSRSPSCRAGRAITARPGRKGKGLGFQGQGALPAPRARRPPLPAGPPPPWRSSGAACRALARCCGSRRPRSAARQRRPLARPRGAMRTSAAATAASAGAGPSGVRGRARQGSSADRPRGAAANAGPPPSPAPPGFASEVATAKPLDLSPCDKLSMMPTNKILCAAGDGRARGGARARARAHAPLAAAAAAARPRPAAAPATRRSRGAGGRGRQL